MKKITIIGSGYVGLSLSAILAQKNDVVTFDINQQKVDLINKKISPIKEEEIEQLLKKPNIKLKASTKKTESINHAELVIICTPTNYDPEANFFDTKIVEECIKDVISINANAYIVIKSTIPIGFTEKQNRKYNTDKIIFSPEFLREGSSIKDNQYPSRVVIGSNNKYAKDFAKIIFDSILAPKENVELIFTGSKEAESIKLFANTYLAMRVSFFNELDSFSLSKNLNSKDIINGVCSDTRIGNKYNNPSFGYGGYCLPKDTKQLNSNYEDIPNPLIQSIITSNNDRKEFIVKSILNLKPNTVGINRLTMKKNSDNFRESAIFDVINSLAKEGVGILIFEPNLEKEFHNYEVTNDIDLMLKRSDLVVSNRYDDYLKNIKKPVFTRDVFNRD